MKVSGSNIKIKTPNNVSISFCKNICEKNNLPKEHNKNVITYDGKLYSFSISCRENRIECRQMYEHTNGVISYSFGDKKFYKIDCVPSGTISRISPLGIKAYNMTFKKSVCSTIDLVN